MNDFIVIFDMDGVILDSERVYQEIERNMYDELGIYVSPEEHRKFMGTSERAMWTYICETFRLNRFVEELVQEERDRFLGMLEIPGTIPLLDGLLPLLEGLEKQKVPCWIASSSSASIIKKILGINDLEKFFRGYVSGDDVSNSKPSPEIFLKAAKIAGTDPSRCLVIEDSENGIKAANTAGMAVVALHTSDSNGPDLSDARLVIDSLLDLNPDALQGLLK